MKTLLTLTALSIALSSSAQVIIERSDDQKHLIIELDSVTYNDAGESMLIKGRKGISSFRFEANDRREALSADQRAALMTKRMTLHLDLNEKQEQLIASINQTHHETMQMLQEREKGFEKQSAILDAQIKHQRELKAVLDVVQYAKFKEMHQDLRESKHDRSSEMNHPSALRLMNLKSDKEHTPAIQIHRMRLDEDRKQHKIHREDQPMSRKRNMVFIGESEKPLMIIDGKETDDQASMSDLDPAQIKAVEVLKGAAAIKKYGEKAKNGVILITTKK